LPDQTAPQTRVDRVDEAGVHLAAGDDLVVDVQFDGRRIWSFWTQRDTRAEGGSQVAEWPPMLKRFLNGTTRLSVVEHVTGAVAYDEEVHLGDGDARIAVVDAEGRPLGIDKSNRISTMFDTRDADQMKPLLDSTEEVLAALHDAGVEAFPAYGTLLGAIREQNFIGHDNDVDLGYVSRHTHPLDVIRESFRLQRTLREKGYAVDRYSAAAFKVDVVEADGAVRGLDVFGGYFLDGRLYLMGEIGTPFQEDWIFPLGTCTLAGRTLPAPARPEKLLEATYGPSWKVPDPAFHFETPRTTYRRLNGWFRGGRATRNEWDRRFSRLRETMPKDKPSALARYVAQQEPDLARLVDVGAGRAADALWVARRGVRTLGLDFAWGAAEPVRRAAADEGAPLELGWMSLNEPRSVFAWGARVARFEEPATLMANHLLDAVDLRGLESFVRFARMALSGGGRLYAEFHTLLPGEDRYVPSGRTDWLRPKDVDEVAHRLETAGAVMVLSTEVEATTRRREFATEDRPVARLVAEWRK
jgi:hypothetical protein